MPTVRLPSSALCLCLALVAGCDEKKAAPAPQKPASSKDGLASGADPRLAAAMAAAAASASAGPRREAANKPGPPEGGVFAPGAADAVMPRGSTPKLELLSDGAEPRVAMKGGASGWKGQASFTVATRLGPRNAMPSVDLVAQLGLDKPGGGKDAKEGKEGKDKDAGAAEGPAALLAQITRASLSAEQPGQIPPELSKEIAKLKGSEIRLSQGEGGEGLAPSEKLSKDAGSDLARPLDEAAEALFFLSVPPPPKPVGAGASFIVGSRQVIGGIDVVSYRLYRVKSASPDRLTLSLEAHQYAASDVVDSPGVPRGAKLGQLESTAQGELEVVPGEALAQKGQVTHQMAMLLRDGDGPQARAMNAQITSEVKMSRGPAK